MVAWDGVPAEVYSDVARARQSLRSHHEERVAAEAAASAPSSPSPAGKGAAASAATPGKGRTVAFDTTALASPLASPLAAAAAAVAAAAAATTTAGGEEPLPLLPPEETVEEAAARTAAEARLAELVDNVGPHCWASLATADATHFYFKPRGPSATFRHELRPGGARLASHGGAHKPAHDASNTAVDQGAVPDDLRGAHAVAIAIVVGGRGRAAAARRGGRGVHWRGGHR